MVTAGYSQHESNNNKVPPQYPEAIYASRPEVDAKALLINPTFSNLLLSNTSFFSNLLSSNTSLLS